MKKTLLVCLLAAASTALHATEPRIIEIATDQTAMVLRVDRAGEIQFMHYGGRIADPTPFLQKDFHRRNYGTDPSPYPAAGGRNVREPALRITHHDGDLNTELTYRRHEVKISADGNIVTTTVVAADKKGVELRLVYNAHRKENVITTHSELFNGERGGITLHSYYSAALPVKASKYLLTHFYGSWGREMQVAHTPLTPGTKSVETRKGVRTTQTENPSFMLSLDTDTFREESGEVIAGALAWSGNFKLNFEVDEHGLLTMLAGINPYASEYPLAGGGRFVTPPVIWTYSRNGAGGASRNLHDWARRYGVHDGGTACPTLLNSWEGAYYKFDSRVLTGMIDDAADMGLEMFVLDDGWFGNEYPRNSDRQGLGDWEVNIAKLPGGIDSIARYARGKGIGFGIWIEPEMANPESVLAKTHPEWIVRAAGREVTTIRNQWLLDLTNPAVQDFVFGVFDRTMRQSPCIGYIKWDANRHVENAGSEFLPDDSQSRFWIDYVQGFYKVCERIRDKYPHVMIQACSAGGGRVEYGVLKYFDEVWTSDNTDPLSRAFIQYGMSMIYPSMVTASHVSAAPNHQTGHVTPLKFRFDMAAAGRLGMELQPKEMTGAEKEFARRAIASYKEFRHIVFRGDLYRIASPADDTGFYALMYVSKDKRDAVVFAYNLRYQSRTLTPRLRLQGLDPARSYRLTELNVDKPRFRGDGQVFGGDYLIEEGINPPLAKLYDSAIYRLRAQE